MKHRAWILTCVWIAACGDEPPAPLESAADTVIGGRRDTRHRAVGQIGQIDGDQVAWFCSGTLIAPSAVLTAAHCLYDEHGRRIPTTSLAFGTGSEVLAVVSARTHRFAPGGSGAWNDIAILSLDGDASVAPIDVASDPPQDGDRATVVGFGVTRATAPHQGTGGGTRRSGSIRLAQIDAEELVYFVDPAGACYGDSGGPVLARSAGREVVIGVTSRGTSVRCSGADIATRVDAYAAWIAQVTGR